jgi:hypothetical protein
MYLRSARPVSLERHHSCKLERHHHDTIAQGLGDYCSAKSQCREESNTSASIDSPLLGDSRVLPK